MTTALLQIHPAFVWLPSTAFFLLVFTFPCILPLSPAWFFYSQHSPISKPSESPHGPQDERQALPTAPTSSRSALRLHSASRLGAIDPLGSGLLSMFFLRGNSAFCPSFYSLLLIPQGSVLTPFLSKSIICGWHALCFPFHSNCHSVCYLPVCPFVPSISLWEL